MTQTTMTAHTPAVRVSNGNQIIDGESYTLLATCNGDDVARALADKLNAYDDLLAAMIDLEQIAHRMGGEHPRHDTLNAATAKARAAIAGGVR